MSPFTVSEQKQQDLAVRMARLGLRETDLDERFILGGGRGGQKVNKTASCVVLRHRPSGLEVRCQAERSQAMNRFRARRRLCERMEERLEGVRSAREQAAERERRRKRRRSRRQKARMLEDKRKQSEKKAARRPPDMEA